MKIPDTIPASVCARLDHSIPQTKVQHSLCRTWGDHHPSKSSCLSSANQQVYSSDLGGNYTFINFANSSDGVVKK